MSDASAQPFVDARANIRDTAKWIMAAVAGLVALMVGSTAISHLGGMDRADPRLWLALASLAVGAGFSWIPFRLSVDVLKSELPSLRQFIAAGPDEPLLAEARDTVAARLAGQIPLQTLAAFQAHFEALRAIALAPPGADNTARDRAAAEITSLAPYFTFCTQTCVTELTLLRLDKLMASLKWPGALIVAAFLVFAWAANPGPPKPGPAPVYQVRVAPAANTAP